jgi:hypothetical protein
MRPIRRYRGGRVVGFHSRAIWGFRGMTGNALRQRVFGGIVLVCVALAYALILWTNLAGTGADHVVDVQPPPPVVSTTAAPRPTASTAYAKLSAALNIYARRRSVSNGYVAPFDSRWSGMFAKTADGVADAEPSAPALSQSSVQKTPEISSAPANGNRPRSLQHRRRRSFDRRKFGPRLWVMAHTRVARFQTRPPIRRQSSRSSSASLSS